MKNFSRFITISKVDEEERMVFGYASTEALDKHGEIVEIDALKRALPGYMEFPTLREMHQPKAAGKTVQASIDSKGMFIGAKVVDDTAWAKVKEGVYPAFSIGGLVKQRVDNRITDLELQEISLVDRPANPEAVVTLFKMEDAEAKRAEFKKMADEIGMKLMTDLYDVQSVLSAACELCYILAFSDRTDAQKQMIEQAIIALKAIAVSMLTTEQMQMMETAMTVSMQKGTLDKEYAKANQPTSDLHKRHVALLKGKKVSFLDYKGIEQLTKQKEAFMQKDETKKEDKKEETPVVPAVETPKEETPVAPEVKEEEKKEEAPAATETPETPAEETPEVKEAGAFMATLEKRLAAIEKAVTPTKQEAPVAKAADNSLAKAEALEKGLALVVSTLEKLASRVSTLENTPAASKTKASYLVNKTGDETTVKAEHKARYEEVKKKLAEFEVMKTVDLAKFQQHQAEVYKLIDEKNTLEMGE